MKQPASERSKVGDVFRIPVDDSNCGFGQLVAKIDPNPWYVAVFAPMFSCGTADLSQIVSSDILLLANSFDSMLKHGYWQSIGNIAPNLSRIPFPWYVVSVNTVENVEVVSYDGKSHRLATSGEAAVLQPRASIGPAVLDSAFKAYHGLGPWEKYYDKLKYAHVKRCSEIAFVQ